MDERAHSTNANVDYRLLPHWTESRRIHRAAQRQSTASRRTTSFPGLHPALVEGTRRIGMPLEDR
jgi:hypothetical protein